jgi:hypothetical protein
MDQTNTDKCSCGCGNNGSHGMKMECCKEHSMSKEHLEMKKQMLEDKLKWVNEELEKAE